MLLEINPDNIDDRKINSITDTLKGGGLIVFPTDTVYSIGCSLYEPSAIKKLAKLKGIKENQINFSLICDDISCLSDYTKNISRPVFRIMRKSLPGPFTFILPASNTIPKIFNSRKKTVGIRIPDNNITLAIVKALGHPLVSTSVLDDDEIIEYTTDPYKIYQDYDHVADIIIDGGYGKNTPSTVVNCTEGDINITREGEGDINMLV